jgi:hypothetical protein
LARICILRKFKNPRFSILTVLKPRITPLSWKFIGNISAISSAWIFSLGRFCLVGHDQELAEDMGFLAVYPCRDWQFPVSIQMQNANSIVHLICLSYMHGLALSNWRLIEGCRDAWSLPPQPFAIPLLSPSVLGGFLLSLSQYLELAIFFSRL